MTECRSVVEITSGVPVRCVLPHGHAGWCRSTVPAGVVAFRSAAANVRCDYCDTRVAPGPDGWHDAQDSPSCMSAPGGFHFVDAPSVPEYPKSNGETND